MARRSRGLLVLSWSWSVFRGTQVRAIQTSKFFWRCPSASICWSNVNQSSNIALSLCSAVNKLNSGYKSGESHEKSKHKFVLSSTSIFSLSDLLCQPRRSCAIDKFFGFDVIHLHPFCCSLGLWGNIQNRTKRLTFCMLSTDALCSLWL